MASIGEIIRVVVGYTHPNASSILNVFYWVVTGAAADNDVLDDFVDWTTNVWAPDWAGLASSDVEITSVKCDVVNNQGVVTRNLGTEVVNLPGGLASDPLESQAAASIFADTAQPKSRGRKFVPGLAEGSIVQGLLSPSVLGVLATVLADYLNPYNGTGDYAPGILSTTIGVFLDFLVAGGFDDIVDTQTRRRPDRGS